MSSKSSRRRVGSHRANDYWQVATYLMDSAKALITLGEEEYGNAIGICLIHSIISANDAVTIKVAEVRSSSEHHGDAIKLLEEVVRNIPPDIIRSFSSVVQAKFEYEYSGDIYTIAEAKRLMKKAERFYTWCEHQLK